MGSVFRHLNTRHFSSQIRKEDVSERIEALDALMVRSDSTLLVSKAVELLSDPNADVRAKAIDAIASVQTSQAASATVEAWASFSDEGLSAAIAALAGIGREAVGTVRKELYHANAAIRTAAVKVLGRIDARTVLTELATALGDKDVRVVRAAARSLGRHRADQFVEDLAVVYRRRPEARLAIVDALENIGTVEALRLIKKASEDADPSVQNQAREVLTQLSTTNP